MHWTPAGCHPPGRSSRRRPTEIKIGPEAQPQHRNYFGRIRPRRVRACTRTGAHCRSLLNNPGPPTAPPNYISEHRDRLPTNSEADWHKCLVGRIAGAMFSTSLIPPRNTAELTPAPFLCNRGRRGAPCHKWTIFRQRLCWHYHSCVRCAPGYPESRAERRHLVRGEAGAKLAPLGAVLRQNAPIGVCAPRCHMTLCCLSAWASTVWARRFAEAGHSSS